MTWDQSNLAKVASDRLQRRESLAPLKMAALAYARWQGLTDEDGVDATAAKRALDRALTDLDTIGPEAWRGMTELAEELGDAVMIGLMEHSIRDGLDRLTDRAAPTIEPTPKPSQKKKKNHDRSQ